MLRIGQIDYANIYPIYHHLNNHSGIRIVKGVPSFLNHAIREGGIDVAPCSSIEYAKSPESYMLIPGISISCIDKVKSVMLYSRFPVEELRDKRIYLTGESGTSVVLVRILLREKYGINPEFTRELEDASAKVLIGDKALFEYYNGSHSYIYDLGTEWHEFTGLPFVFALWTVRKETVQNKWGEIKAFIDDLMKIKADSKKNLAALLDHYTFKGLTSYQIIDYWETIDYNLSDKHIEALLRFYRYAAELGAIKNVPPLHMIT
ncbi:menaquinone biosynthetic enzyme MqnA/MqnD family protein [Limisalsivibrio acetivorans]|uniref:menaquinone biosynthetic enzyme MqnA/MqnD family protein n=1 Tax=Limisalsivibrio acetivorans TaxID=1304888 RepID=UPI0003B55DDF|nr:menaquinone biosynthesis protein [Limisalsivibrio acetivorans]